jgi:hypothetical protein
MIRDVNGTLLDDVEQAFRLAEVGMDLDRCRAVAKDAIDSGNASLTYWRNSSDHDDEAVRQSLLARDLVDVGQHLARISSVRLNSRLRAHLAGEIRVATSRGIKIKSTVYGESEIV